MSEKKKLVIVITSGLHDERGSVAWSMAMGALASDMDLSIFLASSGVDWVRKGAADAVQLNPLDPSTKEMIQSVFDAGCKVMVCPPCAKVRGYEETAFIDGITLAGSPALHALIKEGAATLNF